MRITVMVEFYPPKTQMVEPALPVPGQNPQMSMAFKAIPAVGHLIQSPNSQYPATLYRVALIIHTIHGEVIMKVIPV